MSRLLITILFISCISLVSAKSRLDSALINLDNILKQRSEYNQSKENRISDISSLYEMAPNNESKYMLALQLCNVYSSYNVDSSLVYAKIAYQFAYETNDAKLQNEASIISARTYLLGGMFSEADGLLDHVNRKTLESSLLMQYYTERTTQYRYLAAYVTNNDLTTKYNKLRIAYQDSVFGIINKDDASYSLIYSEQLIDKGLVNEATDILENILQKSNIQKRDYAFLSYTLARANALQNNVEDQKINLALSATSDVYNSVRENVALRELAMLLFSVGDIDRAYTYIKIALDDALYSNARLRSFEILQVMPIIDSAYQELKDKEKWSWMLFSIIALSLLTVIFISLLYNKKQNKRLQIANAEVKNANVALNHLNVELELSNSKVNQSLIRLESANELQGECISKYLKLCSSYIGRIDKYRLSMLKKTVTSNTAELVKMLKSKEVVEKELQAFYADFDKAFLDLYPDFVAKFQDLLHDNEQIVLKQGELLNTELRIYALIRLGITESSQIAEFLRYSNPTIYNYRTKVRNKAKLNREAFDKAVESL